MGKEFILYFFASFLLSIVFMFFLLPGLRYLKFGQSIREEGPQSHQKKSGTPTMGGIVFLFVSALLGILIGIHSGKVLWIVTMMMSFGIIGFLDDFIKVKMKRNLGLTSKQKLIGQLAVAFIGILILFVMGFDTSLSIPGTKFSIDLKWAYSLFFVLLMVGSSNALNLTDGLDGLLAGTSVITLGAFSFIAYKEGLTDVSIFAGVIAASVLGFLLFNKNPARVFMGDTGSLALGGVVAALAAITKTELYLIIIGGVFVAETLSVMIQVFFFKWKKVRIFKMSPVHHHFEYLGWSEWKIVSTFWTVGAALAAIGIWLYL